MFTLIFTQNVILFVYLLIGVFLKSIDQLSGKSVREASFFLANFALSCAVFDSFQTSFSKEKFDLILNSFVIALFFILFLFVVTLLTTKLLKLGESKTSIWIGCSVFSSILFIGIPIVDALYGKVGLIMLVSFNTIFNLFLFGIGESIFSGEFKFSIKKVLKTPALIGVILGLVFFLLDFRLPEMLGTPIHQIGTWTAPLSMIINGAMFYGTPILKIMKSKDVVSFVIFRLLIVPIITIFLFKPFIQNDLLYALVILVSAMPSGSMNTVFAEAYKGEGKLASNYVIISTLFSLLTIPLMLQLSASI